MRNSAQATAIPFLEFELAGGLLVTAFPMPGHSVLSAQLWFTTGAIDESPRERGMAHLSEHFLFQNRTSRQGLVGEIQSCGGDIAALTAPDWTHIRAVFPGSEWLPGVRKLLETLQFQPLEQGAVQREKDVVIEEIRISQSDPMREVTQHLLRGVYGDEHRYSDRVAGTVEEVLRIEVRALENFKRAHYGSKRCHLFLAGPVSDGDVLALQQWSTGVEWNRGKVREKYSPAEILPGGGQSVELPEGLSLAGLGCRVRLYSSEQRLLLRRWVSLLQAELTSSAKQGATPGLLGGQLSLFEGIGGDAFTFLGQVQPGTAGEVLQSVWAWVGMQIEAWNELDWTQAHLDSQTEIALRSEMVHGWLTQRALDWTLGLDPYRSDAFFSPSEQRQILRDIPPFGEPSFVIPTHELSHSEFKLSPLSIHLSDVQPARVTHPFPAALRGAQIQLEGTSELYQGSTKWGGKFVIETRPGTATTAIALSWAGGIGSETTPGMARFISRLRENWGTLEEREGNGVSSWGFLSQSFCRLDSLGIQAMCWSGEEEEFLPEFLSRQLADCTTREEKLHDLWREEVSFAKSLLPSPVECAIEEWKTQFLGDGHPYIRTGFPELPDFPWSSRGDFFEDAGGWLHPPGNIAIVSGRPVEDIRRWIAGAEDTIRSSRDKSYARFKSLFPKVASFRPGRRQMGGGPRATLVVGGNGLSMKHEFWESLQAWSTGMAELSGPLSMALRESIGAVYSVESAVLGGIHPGAWWFVASCESERAQEVANCMEDTILSSVNTRTPSWPAGVGQVMRSRFHVQQESGLARALHHTRTLRTERPVLPVGKEGTRYLETPHSGFHEWLRSTCRQGLGTLLVHHS